MTRFLYLALLVGLLLACSEPDPETKVVDRDAKPEFTRFTQKVLADGLEEPLQIEFDTKGWVYWIERPGNIKRINSAGGQVETLGTVSVAGGPAPGLIGFLLDKDFENSRQLYLYYSALEDKGEIMRLSRFTLGTDNKLNMASETVLLRIPWEQPDGHHFGGGMAWDEQGNLYLSVGCDTAPTQYAPLPFTNEGGRGQDGARTAGNTNDLRGTILRIRPRPDGSYTIPEGNLFPEGTPNTRPEIFIMGNRNPWRLTVDSETGYLHWGEVGPDAGANAEIYGPMGYDEFNVAKAPGNYGWPFIVGKNLPYNSYNYQTGSWGEPYDPESPINSSPNNTGLRELPPAQPALVAYPYKVAEEWPILGSAARSAVGGPVFRQADFAPNAARVFPAYFEGKWLVTDYVRNWIMVITMNSARTEVESIEHLLPPEQLTHKQPLDMDFGPSGDLYLVEYGSGGQGRISRIEYNAGNRAPIALAGAEPSTGAVPLKVGLSSKGSTDFDGDNLNYTWQVKPLTGGQVKNYTQQNPSVTIEQPGRYSVLLRVSDPAGASDSVSLEIVAGNERPAVDFEISSGNQTFYFPGKTIEYKVQVSDKEDGSLANGNIAPSAVAVTAEYIPSGMTFEQLTTLKERGALEEGTALRHLQARSLITQYNCVSCHKLDAPLVGPSFLDVAQKYKEEERVFENLSLSIREGSSGKWGTTAMPPHPMLNDTEVKQIVDFILDVAGTEKGQQSLPVEGSFKTLAYKVKGAGGRMASFFSPPFELGSYVLRATYTDKGSGKAAGLNLTADDIVLLRYPLLAPETADVFSEEGISFTPSTNDPGFIFTGKGGYIGFRNIDLTGINRINIGAITRFWHWSHFVGATIELRLGSPTGTLIGEPYERIPPATSEANGPFFGDAGGRPIPVDVSEIDGVQDIYIVVRNQEAKDTDALVIMTGIEFEQ
ncbi:PQQ-dependent sugar dehydrogenase [Cesiribacter sp. SM1]|uniref:PQQ-dependent sugar dehydrogenase n=1 Tax=Cesiribacter sp. SM1 TaxID=2861196 RepID=UPI001CD51E06|nr:PQQ-dependent sugar dehydrogenase [Cesiribacter sp. SM1]